ncbi:beta-lactamase family protein [Planctomycetota bacterium]|nr:beta-lactamase family protein [Planctomycetota bacterium]
MTTTTPHIVLPRLKELLEEGIADLLHSGAQVYASLNEEPVADFAVGEASTGVPMQTDTLNLWLSSSKPITAISVAQQYERGNIDIDAPVAEYIPDFAKHNKHTITIKHLLTHTAGIRVVPYHYPKDNIARVVDKICNARPEPRWIPGETAGYHLHTSWYLLAYIVQTVSGTLFKKYLRDNIFKPLGMTDCYVGMSDDTYDRLKDRIAIMPNFDDNGTKGGPAGDWESEKAWVTGGRPGGNGYGPMRQLGIFYEALLHGGDHNGARIVEPETVGYFTSRIREGLFDKTFQQTIDWGLGFLLDSKRYGDNDLHYGYGPHASDDTFGHSGYQSSSAFADPHHGLVVAVVCNGTPGELPHRKRMFNILKTLYEELDLA